MRSGSTVITSATSKTPTGTRQCLICWCSRPSRDGRGKTNYRAAMSYWQRPKFWMILIAMEIAAFLLSALIATAVALLCAVFESLHHLPGICIDIVGGLINLYLAYEAFRFARSVARHWPQPPSRGFPVIFEGADRQAGKNSGA